MFSDFTTKINVKKERRFNRRTVIFKFRSKKLACAKCERTNEILTKKLLNIYIETIQENHSVTDNNRNAKMVRDI